ncbi:MAG: hypothetical protein Q8P62_04625 [Candidatus Peregrinibacteria bacterium]|nr:hypothetical protein [Candidatus Peregrinibacteria bacterium]
MAQAYQTKCRKLAGTDYKEAYKKAFNIYSRIKKHSKRRCHIRSKYFNKDKIFLSLFWEHLHNKLNLKDKTRRVKYFECALDLIQNTKFDPVSKENPNKKSEVLHRFTGITKENEIFFVQIKENKKTSQKYFISTFPQKE